MPQVASTAGLYTTFKNTSGHARVFGYLGSRGKRLAANESITVRGDLVSKLGNQLSKRQFAALERGLTRGAAEIVSSPAVYLFDDVTDETRELALVNGQLGTVDPAWDSTGSSLFDDG